MLDVILGTVTLIPGTTRPGVVGRGVALVATLRSRLYVLYVLLLRGWIFDVLGR